MSLIDLLHGAGVTPISEPFSLGYQVYASGSPHPIGPTPTNADDLLVSCLMITSGDRPMIRFALECYQRQLHRKRELVIVTYLDRVDWVRSQLESLGITDASVHGVGRDLTLGDMRNVSVARSTGLVLIQWDDDDLHDPARISAALAMLVNSSVASAVLSRVLFWWPRRELAAVSVSRLWESAGLTWRAHAPVYRSLNRLEDTHALECLTSTRSVLAFDLPLLYVYVAHGDNTCGDDHFETHLAQSTCVLRGADYHDLMALLAPRMPILEYQAAMLST